MPGDLTDAQKDEAEGRPQTIAKEKFTKRERLTGEGSAQKGEIQGSERC